LIAEADRAGVTLGVVFQDRMKPGVRALKASIEAGEFGPLSLVQAQVPWWRPPEYYRESRWRGTRALDGGGALMNQAIHTVDLLLWLCGPVARVVGRAATRFHDIEVEDTAVALIEFTSGALGTLGATPCAYPGRPRRIEIRGTSGTAVLDGDHLEIAAGPSHRRPASVSHGAVLRPHGEPPQNVASPVVSDVSAHRAVFCDFLHAVRTRTSPCCDGPDARRSVQVIEAIYASSGRTRPVHVGEQR